MTIKFRDGYDHYGFANIAKKWDAFTNPNPAGALASIAAARFGSNGFKFRPYSNGAPDWSCYTQKALGSNLRIITIHIAIYIEAPLLMGWVLMQLVDAATAQCDLRVNNTGIVTVSRAGTILGTSGTALNVDAWNHLAVQFIVGDATGSSLTWGAVTVYINDTVTPAINVTNVDTKVSANAYAQVVRVGQIGQGLSGNITTNGYVTLDDCIITDTDYLGNKRVQTFNVTGAGTNAQFTPSTGANYQNVDEATLDEADYNDSGTIGHIDSFTHAPIAVSADTTDVALTVMAASNDGGGTIRPGFWIGGVWYDAGADFALSATDHAQQQGFLLNPATAAAWTPTAFNAAEIGYKKTG